MCGAASNSVTLDPNALTIEATCTPVAPAPTTSIEGATDDIAHASLWVQASSEPGSSSRRGMPPAQTMILSARSRGPLTFDPVRVSEARGAGVLVERDSGKLEIGASQRVPAHVACDLSDAFE
jgi:hypothetical protein